jgi:malate permease and related proteins
VIFVALTVLLATALGVGAERRTDAAQRAARGALRLILYVLLPFVSFFNIARLQLTVGAGVGLAFAYVAIAIAGCAAYVVGTRILKLERSALGGLICSVIVVNTGYLGLPTTVALLGAGQLGPAIAYDQIVSGPMFLLGGFGIGAAFGNHAGEGGLSRVKAFLARNPPLLAVIAGLLAPASLAPNVLVHISHLVVDALLPIGFFVVGVNLSAERREERAPLLERPDRRVIAAVALRLLITPAILALVSATIVKLPTPYLLQAAMPCGLNTLLIGHAYGLELRLIATVIVWSTAAALAVYLTIAAL